MSFDIRACSKGDLDRMQAEVELWRARQNRAEAPSAPESLDEELSDNPGDLVQGDLFACMSHGNTNGESVMLRVPKKNPATSPVQGPQPGPQAVVQGQQPAPVEPGHRAGFTSRDTRTLASHFPKGRGIAGHGPQTTGSGTGKGGGGGGDGGGSGQGQRHSGSGAARVNRAIRSYIRSQNQSASSPQGDQGNQQSNDSGDDSADNQQADDQTPPVDQDDTDLTPEEVLETLPEELL